MRDVVFDYETWLIGPGQAFPKPVCVSTHDGMVGNLKHRNDGAVPYVRYLLEDPDVRVVAANLPFDLGVTQAADPSSAPVIFKALEDGRAVCIQVHERLRRIADGVPAGRVSVEVLAKQYLGLDLSAEKKDKNSWRLRYAELDEVPVSRWPNEAMWYSLNDSKHEWEIWQAQQRKPVTGDLEAKTRASYAMALIAGWGLRADEERVKALGDKLRAAAAPLTEALAREGFIREDGTKDTKRIALAVEQAYKQRGMEIPRTDSGAVSTTAEALEAVDDPLLKTLAEYNASLKNLSTYLPSVERAVNAPIHCRYDILETGRYASSGEPIQQFPRDGGFRECFRPRPGWVYIDSDYETAELCSMSQTCIDLFGYSKMGEAIREGKDLHILTASQILDIGYDDAIRRKKAEDVLVSDARQMSKAFNFGKLGGLGPVKMVLYALNNYGVYFCGKGRSPGPAHNARMHHKRDRDSGEWVSTGVCEACVQTFMALDAKWLDLYPEMKSYFKHVNNQLGGWGSTTTRVQPRSGRVRGGVGYTDYCNAGAQEPTADGATLAAYNVVKECYAVPTSWLYGCRPVVFAHDQLLVEAPVDQAPWAAKRLEEVMIESMQVFTPDVPARVDTRLCTQFSKKSKRIVGPDGLLKVWSPE